MIRFEVDPSLVADALAEGRKLIVTIGGDRHQYRRVTLGDPSPHRQPIAIAKRAA